MKLLQLLALTLVSCVLAQTTVPSPPQPCYISKTLTSEVYQAFLYDGSYEINTGTLYLDIPSKLLRFDVVAGVEDFGGLEVAYSLSIFQNYNTGTYYIYDQSDKTCSSFPLTAPLGSGELPSDSIYAGQILIGSQAIQEYVFNQSSGTTQFTIEAGVTAGSCLIYNLDIYNTTTSGQPDLLMTEAFWNFVPSVSPFIFDPPSACTNNLMHFSFFSEEIRKKANIAMYALDLHNSAF